MADTSYKAPTTDAAPKAEKVPSGALSDAELVVHLQECIRSGEEYRDRFRDTWEEVEKQIRCVPPEEWEKKDDWQTKIFIPLQAKKEEIAVSYLKKMVFGKGRFFDIQGHEASDHDQAQHLTNLVDVLLNLGRFSEANDFVVAEAVGSPGTSFLKVLMRPDGYLEFTWRSPYNVLIDPECGHRLDRARFIIDVYRKDLAYLIQQARGNGLYAKHRADIDAFLQMAAEEAKKLHEVYALGNTPTDAQESMTVVKGIDGTTDVTIPSRYKQLDFHECWVCVPNDKGEYQWELCALINKTHLIRRVAHPYGCHPWVWCRTKPRKYDAYGRGYLENGRGFQDLSNSMVNLGFDSAKISAMDIIVLDDNKVKDSTSIKYKPLAVWKMRDVNGVKIQRQPVSAITDVIRGLTLIDQLDQDASGITRQAQGSPNLSGSGTNEETLGQYELKLQMVDQRFLDQGRFIEHDYVVPLITLIVKIILNEKLFSQDKVNKLIGMRTVDQIEQVEELDNAGEPVVRAKVVGTTQVPKLVLADLRRKGEMAFNFKAVGITQFTGRLEQLQKLKEGLQAALSNPTLTALTKVDVLYKKLWQLSEIEDYDEFLRTKDEVKQMLTQQQAAQQGPPVPTGMPPRPAPTPQPATAGAF